MPVYLLHFEKPLHHAQHYIGFCEEGNLQARLETHLAGRGGRLVAAVAKLGIAVHVARYWPEGDRSFERKLKKHKCGPRLCPICQEG